MVKTLPANAEDSRDMGSIPVFGRSPGEGNVNPLQYSFLENPMDRGAWWAAVLEGWERVRHAHVHMCARAHTHTHTHTHTSFPSTGDSESVSC